MATNLKIDDVLLDEAVRIGGLKTKRETVNEALKEFVQKRRQMKVLDLAGTIDFAPEYDYREQRNRP